MDKEKWAVAKAQAKDMVKKQGGYCTIGDVRKATGLKYGNPLAKKMAKDGTLLHVAHDRYKLTTTEVEVEMAKRDVPVAAVVVRKRKARRGIGSY